MLNPTSEQVLQLINQRSDTCNDQEVNAKELQPQAQLNDPIINFNIQNQQLPLTTSAVSQFLNRLKVPIIFYKRCTLDLQQRIINEHNKDRDFLIRSIVEGDSVTCRAVLSNHFSRDKDDKHIFPPALEALEDRSMNSSLAQFTYDENFTHLLANFDDCAVVQGDNRLTASLSLINSETGHSSVWIYPTVIVNGYEYANRRGNVSNNIHRIIHRGQLKPEEFQQVIRDTKDIAQVGIVQYLRAQNETVTVDHANDFVETIEDLPNRFKNILKTEWQIRENIEKARVMEGIMQLAQELPLFQKLSVSRQVGRFIKLFENIERDRAEVVEQLGN